MARTDGDTRARRRHRLTLLPALVALAGAVPASPGTTDDARADTEAHAEADANIGIADAVHVDKSERRLDLLRDGAVIASFDIALGFEPDGHKTEEGDGRTPEGTYRLDWRNPQSQFHLSLHISYPDAADRAEAEARGVSPGGDIFIHGTPLWANGSGDWTLGCIAVSNDEIETIWDAVPNGTPITIEP